MPLSPRDPRIDGEPSKGRVTIRIIDNATDVEKLLPLTVLKRLYSSDVPSRVRRCNISPFHVVTALDDEAASDLRRPRQ